MFLIVNRLTSRNVALANRTKTLPRGFIAGDARGERMRRGSDRAQENLFEGGIHPEGCVAVG